MLTQYLERCNRFISLDPIERSVFTSHYDRIRDHVIDQMKMDDDLFNEIFHRTQLSGSYADQLKVSEPNEYDVLMILRLPYFVVQKIKRKPGYVQIYGNQYNRYGIIERILDRDGYLMQNKVLEWLRGIMKRIFPNRCNLLKIGNHEYNVSHAVNGPANSLDIQCRSYSDQSTRYSNDRNTKFSIDFVGALEFSVKEVWMADAGTPKQFFLNSYWNAIPKPRKPTRKPFYLQGQRNHTGANVDANTLRKRQLRNLNRNRAWMCSYAEIERELIRDYQFIKPLIRIFKKIRDTQKMSNFKSYYIKQIFIHQRMLQDPSYWEQPLGELFLAMLDVIIKYLECRNLRFYWHKELNLLNHFNWKQIDDLTNKFRRIQHDIFTLGPDYICNVICTDVEQRQINRFV